MNTLWYNYATLQWEDMPRPLRGQISDAQAKDHLPVSQHAHFDQLCADGKPVELAFLETLSKALGIEVQP